MINNVVSVQVSPQGVKQKSAVSLPALPATPSLPLHELNSPTTIDARGRLPEAQLSASKIRYFDVSGDGFLAPLDVLLIVNEMNAPLQAEGEDPTTGRGSPTHIGYVHAQLASSSEVLTLEKGWSQDAASTAATKGSRLAPSSTLTDRAHG